MLKASSKVCLAGWSGKSVCSLHTLLTICIISVRLWHTVVETGCSIGNGLPTYAFRHTLKLPEVCELVNSEGLRALQFYETGLVDPKLWPFGDDLRERFELTRVSCHLIT